jgi:hypothetical protein
MYYFREMTLGARNKETLIGSGIPQCYPLSPIPYLFYNADMVEDFLQGVLAVVYVDNICFLI